MNFKKYFKRIKLPQIQVDFTWLHKFIAWLKYTYEKMKKWDWKVISICFGTAFTFWIFNSLNDSHTGQISIPIELIYDEENIVTLQKPPTGITINVSGNGWNLLNKAVNAAQDPIEITLNKSSLLEMNYIITNDFLPQVANRFRDMQINYIVEDSLYFDFDTISTKTIHLILTENDIPLKENYKIISDLEISPNKATFTGASSLLKKYPDSIHVFLDENEIDSDFSKNISVAFPEHPMVSVDTEETEVNFKVSEFDKRYLKVVPQLMNFTLPEGKRVTVIPSEARVEYMIEVDENYVPQDSLKVLLDFRRLNKIDSTISPRLVYPNYMIETKVIPSKFVISIGDDE